MKNQRGFSVIELIAVMAVLAAASAIFLTAINKIESSRYASLVDRAAAEKLLSQISFLTTIDLGAVAASGDNATREEVGDTGNTGLLYPLATGETRGKLIESPDGGFGDYALSVTVIPLVLDGGALRVAGVSETPDFHQSDIEITATVPTFRREAMQTRTFTQSLVR